MKNLKMVLMALVLCLGVATTGWSITISGGTYGGVDVGSVDTYLDSTNSLANSSPSTETAWVNTILTQDNAIYVTKDGDNIPYYNTDESGVFAFHIQTSGIDYFLIKNSDWWALYANVEEYNWGVFKSSDLPGGMNLPSSGYTISHVTQFTGDPHTAVPEPSTVLLLGLGLVGLATAGRKKFMK